MCVIKITCRSKNRKNWRVDNDGALAFRLIFGAIIWKSFFFFAFIWFNLSAMDYIRYGFFFNFKGYLMDIINKNSHSIIIINCWNLVDDDKKDIFHFVIEIFFLSNVVSYIIIHILITYLPPFHSNMFSKIIKIAEGRN